MKFATSLALICMFLTGSCAGKVVSNAHDADKAYATLRVAYSLRDTNTAVEAYSANSDYREVWPEQPQVVRRGRLEIAQGFSKLFSDLQSGPGELPLDLYFRLVSRRQDGSVTVDKGWYRLRHGPGQGASRAALCGHFETRIENGVFTQDISTAGTLSDFETASGPMLLDSDGETLAPQFYDPLLGTYHAQDGCHIRITRSSRALFAYNHCSNQWRRLNRKSGHEWVAGDELIESGAGKSRYRFSVDGRSFKATTLNSTTQHLRRADEIVLRQGQFR
jgi:hypothetical protein